MQRVNGVSPGLAGMEKTHAHLPWLVSVVGLRWACISRWASPASLLVVLPLGLRQDGNATNPPGRSGSGSLLRHLSSFSWSWRAVSPQQPRGEEAKPPAAASPFSPAAAGML